MRFVVGLGNPGERYRRSRHNVGFMVIDRLAARATGGREVLAPDAWALEARLAGCPLLLVKPQTWMNRSGLAVSRLLGESSALPAELVVVLDDAALAPGRIRVRAHGSHGGHNGLRSIIEELGTEEFPRIRVGVGGADGIRDDLGEYILSDISGRDTLIVRRAVEQASRAVVAVVRDGIPAAMNRFNAKPREAQIADGAEPSKSEVPDREPAPDSLPPTGKGPRGA